jgi:hypothetical protein
MYSRNLRTLKHLRPAIHENAERRCAAAPLRRCA